MSDESRIERAVQLASEGPCRDEVTVDFLIYAADKGECLDDPLKDEFTFHAAWSAYQEGQMVAERQRVQRRTRELIKQRDMQGGRR